MQADGHQIRCKAFRHLRAIRHAKGIPMELNSKVADFTLETDEEKKVSLSDFKGKPVILFFYPRADTPGSTVESCSFRDAVSKFTKKGVTVIGVSPDTTKAQAKFKEKFGADPRNH